MRAGPASVQTRSPRPNLVDGESVATRVSHHVRAKSRAARRCRQGPKAPRTRGRSEAENLEDTEHRSTMTRRDGRAVTRWEAGAEDTCKQAGSVLGGRRQAHSHAARTRIATTVVILRRTPPPCASPSCADRASCK